MIFLKLLFFIETMEVLLIDVWKLKINSFKSKYLKMGLYL